MKRFLLVLVLFVLGVSKTAYCHPPSDIIISFDKDTKMVKAVILHSVQNPERHFIYKVDVSINGKEVIGHKISRQDNNTSQTVEYSLPDISEGNTIAVEGYCNISGMLEKEIKI